MLCIAVMLGGCANQLKPEDLAAGATGALAAIPKAAAQLAEGLKKPVGTPTEVYSRVAQGALTCWMGPYGRLRATHLFQAEAEPPHKGGRSEISIHERIPDAPNKPGKRVFEVIIQADGQSTIVEARNLRLPVAQGDAMQQDVQRWAANEEGCLPDGVTAGWDAKPADQSDSAKHGAKSKVIKASSPPRSAGR
jgi:hypothetical protein